MVDKNHNIIITQVQKNIASNERIQELTFNHPVKYIASSDTSGNGALTSTSNKVKIQNSRENERDSNIGAGEKP